MHTIRTIYLADDDADDRFLMVEAIKNVAPEIQVVEAENGAELLKIMQDSEQESSLVVLDMNMPRMNGLETIRAIRTNPNLSLIPAVMLSTSADTSFTKLAYQAGISHYFTKPNSFEAFTDLVQQLISQFL